MITVVVADDQALVRAGFRKILDTEPDIDVVAEAGDGRDAVDTVTAARPDIALLDIRMPRMDGIEAARIITCTPGLSTRVMMLTTFGIDDYVFAALKAGASGFLLKDAPPDQLIDAVRVVAAGEAILARAVTRAVVERFAERGTTNAELRRRIDTLTVREAQVLGLLSRGLSNTEIAATLVVSEATAKSHVAGIFTKLGVRDRVQAVIAAYESGLVNPGMSSGTD
jgi:DNA-binding NarL/FixJ family response regulator